MLKIGYTGSNGLIGWHFGCFLKTRSDARAFGANRATFLSQSVLDEFVQSCDVIVHLAGVNRGTENEVASGNIALASSLVEALERNSRRPHLIFSSSIHALSNNHYGTVKNQCSEIFRTWSRRNNACFTNLILPHVFGEHGRPFYNSVVSTFCHQIARSEQPTINSNGELELLHAQSVAKLFFDVANSDRPAGLAEDIRPSGRKITVLELAEELRMLAQTYADGTIPDLNDPFRLDLFNTYRSYLYPTQYPITLPLRSDQRGALFEAVKTQMGGQCFLSTTIPGITRGNHYHLRKFERFLVTSGEAIIRIRKLSTDRVIEFPVSGSKPQVVDIPTLHTHSIINTGTDDLTTLFWSHEIFDPKNPDTYPETV